MARNKHPRSEAVPDTLIFTMDKREKVGVLVQTTLIVVIKVGKERALPVFRQSC